MEKISVIVSVYNTEKYVKRCIDSIINQSYKNIELIIIDDGSSDNSRKILESYSNLKQVKLILNDDNHGLAYSRNIGVEKATGKYVGFIDSDDYIACDYYEKMMNSIVSNKSEVSICDIKLIYELNNEERIAKCYDDVFDVGNVVNNGLAASACNKLFLKELIINNKFETGKVNEDIAVVIPAICKAKKISYVEECYYNYIQRNNSIQNSSFSMKRFDIFDAIETTSERIKKVKGYNEIMESLVFNQLILLFIYVIPKEKKFLKRFKILRKYYHKAKKLNIYKNNKLVTFLSNVGKKHYYYYKLLLWFEKNGLTLFADLLISFYRIASKIKKNKSVIKRNITINDLIKEAKKQSKLKKEKISISVVIPNYNYEKFLLQRLYSILIQNYKIEEILILDDKSKDNSIKLIEEIVISLKPYVNINSIYNNVNSGIAFKQWKKGFENVSGDYVWIAEADDYCNCKLLKTLVKPIEKDNDILISYADTAFINADGNYKRKSIVPEIDIMKTNHWKKSFVDNGLYEIENYAFLNCTIANVSSCIIKNGTYDSFLTESCEYRQAGDWVFYLNVMSKGKIAYSNKVLNYYRVHGNNISSTMNYKKHIDEIRKIHKKIEKDFGVSKFQKDEMKKRIDFLKKCWKVK